MKLKSMVAVALLAPIIAIAAGVEVVVLTPKECELVDQAVMAHVNKQKKPKLTKNAKKLVDFILGNNTVEQLKLLEPGQLTMMCFLAEGRAELPKRQKM